MKTAFSYFICAAAVQIFATGISNAQTLELKPAPGGVAIDGNSKEWGDNMAYTDAKSKISYTLTNDKDNLYLVIKTKDPVQQSSILGAGVTFSVDVKGRKKSSFVVAYPVSAVDRDQSRYIDMTPEKTKVNTDFGSKYGKIRPEGFADISDEQLTVINAFGIQAAIGYDDATGYMTYEESIPLALFHAGDYLTKEWGFSIQLNPVQGREKSAPALRQVENGARPGNKGKKDSGRDDFSKGNTALIDLTEKVNFWGKLTLAKI